MPKLRLKRGRERGIKQGVLWVHANDVDRISPSAVDGEPIDIVDSKDRFLARATLNRSSRIVARIYSYRREDLDEDLLRRRIKRAIERRKRWGLDMEACRLVYADADLLPGLIVDLYGPIVVLQILHLAMDLRREQVVRILEDLLGSEAIYERSDVGTRIQEGLPPRKALLRGKLPQELWVSEGEVQIFVDVEGGHKTGLYLDQRSNRMRIKSLACGRRVLDLFSYTGGFGLQAMAGGAEEVTAVDSSKEALQVARRNILRAGWNERFKLVNANAFDFLRHVDQKGERYDMVFLDPPSFAPTREAITSASRGYKELNLRALRVLEPGGILVSSCCSFHIPFGLHLQLIVEAAADAGKEVVLLHQWGQGLDHPVLPSHPQTRYLKCHVLEVYPRA